MVNAFKTGRITVSNNLLMTKTDNVLRIFWMLKFLPLQIVKSTMKGYTDYIGLSDEFEELGREDPIPAYNIIITSKNDKIHSVRVEKSPMAIGPKQ